MHKKGLRLLEITPICTYHRRSERFLLIKTNLNTIDGQLQHASTRLICKSRGYNVSSPKQGRINP